MNKKGNALLNLPRTLFTHNYANSFNEPPDDQNLTSLDEGTEIKMDRRFSPINRHIV